jgi:phospholipid/cholesterol/gamma-HCH transport system substrate-binding protein
MTNEAKVGAFTLLGIILMAFIVVHLSGFSFGGDKDYKLQVLFSQVNGLKQGAVVRYAGVDVGKVTELRPTDGGVTVTLKVKDEIKVPRESVFTITGDGLMGEKFINIIPTEEDMGEYLKPGDVVTGTPERGMEAMANTANATMEEMQALVRSMNRIMGNRDVQDSLIQTATNLRDITAALSRMAVSNESDLRVMVHNLSRMSQSLMEAADSVNRMVDTFSGDGETAENLRFAIANLSSTSQRIDNMASNLEGVVADPGTAEDLRAVIHNARAVTQQADTMMTKVSSIHTEVGAEMLYSGGNKDWMANADFRIYSDPNSFLLLGIDDIGEGNKANVQIGRGNGYLTGRAGMIDSKAGVGVDAYAGDKWKISAEAYDMNNLAVKLRAQYEVAADTYVVGQINDVNKGDKRATYIGLRRTF